METPPEIVAQVTSQLCLRSENIVFIKLSEGDVRVMFPWSKLFSFISSRGHLPFSTSLELFIHSDTFAFLFLIPQNAHDHSPKYLFSFFYYHHKPSCFSSSPSCGFCLYCCPDFLPHACLRLFHNVICYDCAFVLVCGYVPHDCLNGSLTEASQMESCVRIEEIIHSSS